MTNAQNRPKTCYKTEDLLSLPFVAKYCCCNFDKNHTPLELLVVKFPVESWTPPTYRRKLVIHRECQQGITLSIRCCKPGFRDASIKSLFYFRRCIVSNPLYFKTKNIGLWYRLQYPLLKRTFQNISSIVFCIYFL